MSDGRPAPDLPGLVAVPTYRDRPSTTAADVAGVRLDGDPARITVRGTGHWSLLFFLSSGCQGCLEIWEALGRAGGGGMVSDEAVVVVTREPGREDVGTLRRLAPPGVPVVLSAQAWSAYRVHGPPFFVLVDGRDDRVVTEGVAWGPAQIGDHVRRARAGLAGPEVPLLVPPEDPGPAS